MPTTLCIKTIKHATSILTAEKIDTNIHSKVAISYGKFIDIYDIDFQHVERVFTYGCVVYMAVVEDFRSNYLLDGCGNKVRLNDKSRYLILISNESYCTVIKINETVNTIQNNANTLFDNSTIMFKNRITKNIREPLKCTHNNKAVVILYPDNLIFVLSIEKSNLVVRKISDFKFHDVLDISISPGYSSRAINKRSCCECIKSETINKNKFCINRDEVKRIHTSSSQINKNANDDSYKNDNSDSYKNKILNKDYRDNYINSDFKRIPPNNAYADISLKNYNIQNCELSIITNSIDNKTYVHSFSTASSPKNFQLSSKKLINNAYKIINLNNTNLNYKLVFTTTDVFLLNSKGVIEYEFKFANTNVLGHCFIDSNEFLESYNLFSDDDTPNINNTPPIINRNNNLIYRLLIGTGNGELFYFEIYFQGQNINFEREEEELIKMEMSIENQIRRGDGKQKFQQDSNFYSDVFKCLNKSICSRENNTSDEKTLLEIEKTLEKLETENVSKNNKNERNKISIKRKILVKANAPIERILFLGGNRFFLTSKYGNSFIFEFPDKFKLIFQNYPMFDDLKIKNGVLSFISKTDNYKGKSFNEVNDNKSIHSNNNIINYLFQMKYQININLVPIFTVEEHKLHEFFLFKDLLFVTTKGETIILKSKCEKINEHTAECFKIKENNFDNFYSKDNNNFDNIAKTNNFYNKDSNTDVTKCYNSEFRLLKRTMKILNVHFYNGNIYYTGTSALCIFHEYKLKNQIKTERIIQSVFHKNKVLLVHEKKLRLYNLDYFMRINEKELTCKILNVESLNNEMIRQISLYFQIASIFFEDFIYISTFENKLLILDHELKEVDQFELAPLYSFARIGKNDVDCNESEVINNINSNTNAYINNTLRINNVSFLAITLNGELMTFCIKYNMEEKKINVKYLSKRNQLSKITKIENKLLISGEDPLVVDEKLKIYRLGIERIDHFKYYDDNICISSGNNIFRLNSQFKPEYLLSPTLIRREVKFHIPIRNNKGIMDVKELYNRHRDNPDINNHRDNPDINNHRDSPDINNHRDSPDINNHRDNYKINDQKLEKYNMDINNNSYIIGYLLFNNEINSEISLISNSRNIKKLYFEKEILIKGAEVEQNFVCCTNYELTRNNDESKINNFKNINNDKNENINNDKNENINNDKNENINNDKNENINNDKNENINNDKNENINNDMNKYNNTSINDDGIFSKIYLISKNLKILQVIAQKGHLFCLATFKNLIATSHGQFIFIYSVENKKIYFKSKLRIPIMPFYCYLENKSFILCDFINGFSEYSIERGEIKSKNNNGEDSDYHIKYYSDDSTDNDDEQSSLDNSFGSLNSLDSFSSSDLLQDKNELKTNKRIVNPSIDNNHELMIIEKRKYYGELVAVSAICNFGMGIVIDDRGRILFYNNYKERYSDNNRQKYNYYAPNNKLNDKFEIKTHCVFNYRERILSVTKGSFFETLNSEHSIYFSTINGSIGVVSKIEFDLARSVYEIQKLIKKSVFVDFDDSNSINNFTNDENNYNSINNDFINNNFTNDDKLRFIDVDLVSHFYTLPPCFFEENYLKFKRIIDDFMQILDN